MNSVFGAYSRYYDLLYHDKEYEREAAFIISSLRAKHPHLTTILDLGCGTGLHAEMFANQGFTVHGLDISETMLKRADDRKGRLSAAVSRRITFEQSDIRSARVPQQFDAVVSLFHVISYQKTLDDLRAVFDTAAAHLVAGGAFFFDYWYGPAVLHQLPSVRVKRLQDRNVRVIRIAEPTLRAAENRVTVDYEVFVEQASGLFERLHETHEMRYWFTMEINQLLQEAGFTDLSTYAWLTAESPDIQSWSACTCAILS